MSNAYAVLAGIVAGVVIAGVAWLRTRNSTESSYTSNQNYDNERTINNYMCFKCHNDSPSLLELLCGHRIHISCLYSSLKSSSVNVLRDFRISCGCSNPTLISYSMVKQVLSSRCCVCEETFSSETVTLCCGHKLHRDCLQADRARQFIDGQPVYTCPYSLLECGMTMDVNNLSPL